MSRLAQALSEIDNPAEDTRQAEKVVEGIATALFTLQSLGMLAFPSGFLMEEQIRDKLDYAAALGVIKFNESKSS